MSAAQSPPGLADRLALVLDGLCRLLAVRASRDVVARPLMLLLWGRLHRTLQRFASLAARHRAGTLRPARPSSRRPAPNRPPPPRLPRLPGRFGWLVAGLPQAHAYGHDLRCILEDPETVALIEAAPQAGRLLRPLCRMLAVPLPPALAPALAPKPRPARPRPARPWPPPRSVDLPAEPRPPLALRSTHPCHPSQRHPSDRWWLPPPGRLVPT